MDFVLTDYLKKIKYLPFLYLKRNIKFESIITLFYIGIYIIFLRRFCSPYTIKQLDREPHSTYAAIVVTRKIQFCNALNVALNLVLQSYKTHISWERFVENFYISLHSGRCIIQYLSPKTSGNYSTSINLSTCHNLTPK